MRQRYVALILVSFSAPLFGMSRALISAHHRPNSQHFLLQGNRVSLTHHAPIDPLLARAVKCLLAHRPTRLVAQHIEIERRLIDEPHRAVWARLAKYQAQCAAFEQEQSEEYGFQSPTQMSEQEPESTHTTDGMIHAIVHQEFLNFCHTAHRASPLFLSQNKDTTQYPQWVLRKLEYEIKRELIESHRSAKEPFTYATDSALGITDLTLLDCLLSKVPDKHITLALLGPEAHALHQDSAGNAQKYSISIARNTQRLKHVMNWMKNNYPLATLSWYAFDSSADYQKAIKQDKNLAADVYIAQDYANKDHENNPLYADEVFTERIVRDIFLRNPLLKSHAVVYALCWRHRENQSPYQRLKVSPDVSRVAADEMVLMPQKSMHARSVTLKNL